MTQPKEAEAVALVYVVACIDAQGVEVKHIFSTQERAHAFADKDTAREHIFYDYLVDAPERHEGDVQ